MLPELKAQVAIGAVSATNGGTVTSSTIDCKGYDFLTLDIWGTTQSASTQAGSPSVLKLQEADDTNATSFADIAGARGASATATNVDFLVGIGKTTTSTTAANAYKFNVDLRGRKRYLQAVISPTTSQTFYGVANLGRGEQSPSNATKANVLNLVAL